MNVWLTDYTEVFVRAIRVPPARDVLLRFGHRGQHWHLTAHEPRILEPERRVVTNDVALVLLQRGGPSAAQVAEELPAVVRHLRSLRGEVEGKEVRHDDDSLIKGEPCEQRVPARRRAKAVPRQVEQ